jgi:Fe-S oxidoreductase
MCPSFKVTREEKHSTRGRAHLLNEMLRGDSPLQDGWRSEAVKEALDLCLACKGCKADCPMSVDMAMYKSEFLSHYYEGRSRPVTAYSMGLIDVWAQLASHAPRLANFFTQTPVLRAIAKKLAGIAPQRQIPRFAERTFKDWFRKRRRPAAATAREPVVLWADTFNNYFHPRSAIAAVEVLEAAGFEVIVPGEHLCCGRPLYDFGMLDLAKVYLQRVLTHLKPHLEAGTPIVGLEPSCVSVFRDELKQLMPADIDAQRLSARVFLLSEFLDQFAKDFQPPRLPARAVVHGHCHHKAVLNKMSDEKRWFEKLGIEAELLDSGCCGMAGSFGFENTKDHYDVSMKAGEDVLLPAVRQAGEKTLVVADGFSCREQIEQGTSRRALHFAEVVQLALRKTSPKEGSDMEDFDVVESYSRALEDAGVTRPARLAGWLLAGGALTLLTLFQVSRKWRS